MEEIKYKHSSRHPNAQHSDNGMTYDLIHEIFTVGPYLKRANNFLRSFKLKAPLGGLKNKGFIMWMVEMLSTGRITSMR
ncbi:hypothetical protein KFK09_028210 [Dendrobium nobile]|uniref:Uncharacterized protein n=1 Tax=Dendrobium nobile TaxID=94219 RepID=A0A8T3A2Y5_DENNO|nr:hypothetical protein KFK09_028210 [Dendrobium nobile]